MAGIRLDQWESATQAVPSAETQNAPKLYPGQALVESGVRATQRALRMRETPRALEASYAAKTAAAAKGFGDTANVAVEERKMMQSSFARDGDTYEGRNVLRQSLLGSRTGFFDSKEKMLMGILQAPTPQILKGYSKNGPRFEVDPTIMAQKRQAATDLARLQQTRVMYQQMFDEADQKMPPIGAPTPTGSEGPSSHSSALAPEESDIVRRLLGH